MIMIYYYTNYLKTFFNYLNNLQVKNKMLIKQCILSVRIIKLDLDLIYIMFIVYIINVYYGYLASNNLNSYNNVIV